MTAQPISMSEWATRLGRNDRWLEQKTVIAISTYADHHRRLCAEHPEQRAEITAQLNEALQAQLDYAVWLTEHSKIGGAA